MPGPRENIHPGPGKLALKDVPLGLVHNAVLLSLDDHSPGGQTGEQGSQITGQQIIETGRQGPGDGRGSKRPPGPGEQRRLPGGQALSGKIRQHRWGLPPGPGAWPGPRPGVVPRDNPAAGSEPASPPGPPPRGRARQAAHASRRGSPRDQPTNRQSVRGNSPNKSGKPVPLPKPGQWASRPSAGLRRPRPVVPRPRRCLPSHGAGPGWS